MPALDPSKLHVRLEEGTNRERLVAPRKYTLTHSDRTGDLFLTIGSDYDGKTVSGLYTRLMRDEVLAEWVPAPSGFELHVHLHVSGGLVVGLAGWRDSIFRRHLPQVLQALRYADRPLFKAHPWLDQAPIRVHFHASQDRFNRVEPWGRLHDYALPRPGASRARVETAERRGAGV